MTLLQIHEPGETPLPHADEIELAVGIDLGTTHSVVAIVQDGVAEILTGADGNALVPSVVHYGVQGVEVGAAAHRYLHAGSATTISSIKRLMGVGTEDITRIAGALPFDVVKSEGKGMVRLAIGDKVYSPVEISAEILKAIKAQAENKLGKPVHKAVITVPAYFDDAARTATRDAARLAGLEVLRLIAEPTAAALAYGLDSGAEGVYAVYDLGGGTFDISLLRLEKGVFQVLATGGDAALGGDDFDQLIVEYLCKQLPADLTKDPATIRQLMAQARQIKEYLSDHDEGSWTINAGEICQDITLTRSAFEQMIASLAKRTLMACQQTLDDAGVTVEDVQGLVLVGGSTRVPLIRAEVSAFFDQTPCEGVDPDQVVAVGAALQAEGLTRGSSNLLLDVVPLSLGLETMGGIVEKLVHRNTPIPVSVAQEFTTYKDGQTGMMLHVVQGEREMVDQCRSLAQFELTGIPSMVAGSARIRVTFTVDADGLLTISAREEMTGTEQRVEVKPSYGLEIDEIEQMLRDSMVHAREDMTTRFLTESRVEAERNMLAVKAALEYDGALLTEGERAEIESQLDKLAAAVQTSDRDLIDNEARILEERIKPFAEKRMSASVSHALQGHEVEEVERKLLTNQE